MGWMAKARIQRCLAALPPSIGDPIYHRIQHLHGLEPQCPSYWQFCKNLRKLLLEVRGRDLSGLRAVELGAGWYPLTPLMLLCLGAREVHTFDTNQHYSSRRIAAAARALMSWRPDFADSPVLRQTVRSGRLPDSIRYYPRTDICSAGDRIGPPVDLAFSRAVLEHIPRDIIGDIHRSSLLWMAPDSCWIHLVSPSDHRAYSDPQLHLADFLRYSEEEWTRLSGNRYAYHNRLRRPQFRNAFEQAGWAVQVDRADISPQALETLEQIPLHEQFRRFPPEDLVAGSLWFVLGKGETAPPGI